VRRFEMNMRNRTSSAYLRPAEPEGAVEEVT
jgi:hypothetical protein